jgi:hypothetical protein
VTGATLDTGALIALKSGSRRMAVLIEEALAGRAELCARDRGHPVVTSDPGDIHAVEPSLKLLSPG